jgi:outer membrane lipopolysaccharide assembly protein LptE/RlpB
MTKELAKLLKASLKVQFPYCTFKVTTQRGIALDQITVNFDGEVDVNELRAICRSWTTDSLSVIAQGKAYKLMEVA